MQIYYDARKDMYEIKIFRSEIGEHAYYNRLDILKSQMWDMLAFMAKETIKANIHKELKNHG